MTRERIASPLLPGGDLVWRCSTARLWRWPTAAGEQSDRQPLGGRGGGVRGDVGGTNDASMPTTGSQRASRVSSNWMPRRGSLPSPRSATPGPGLVLIGGAAAGR